MTSTPSSTPTDLKADPASVFSTREALTTTV